MSTRDAEKILAEARDLVSSGWTKGFMARDGEGQPTQPLHQAAVCWCVMGALVKASVKPESDFGASSADSAALLHRFLPWGVGLAEFNDDPTTGQEDVLRLLDQAIAAARES